MSLFTRTSVGVIGFLIIIISIYNYEWGTFTILKFTLQL